MRALIINCSPVRTGATDAIVRIIAEQLAGRYDVKAVCIDDYTFAFCKGCRSCHTTAECMQHDDVDTYIIHMLCNIEVHLSIVVEFRRQNLVCKDPLESDGQKIKGH